MNPLHPLAFRSGKLMAALLPAMVLWAAPLAAAPTTPSPGTNSVLSVFVRPTNPSEGRDPFFPQSSRPYEGTANSNTTTNRSTVISALVVRGVSGSTDRRLVIINNHTFAAGDAADVMTDQGRIRVRCVEIKPRVVIVEVGGQYHELPLSDYP